MTTIINIKKKELQKKGINDFEDWISKPNTVYIGRNMEVYVAGAKKSIWANPFSIKKYGLDTCLQLYEEYIKNNKSLYYRLSELEGKELGCWCKPNKCHGDILIKLLKYKRDLGPSYSLPISLI